MGYQNAIDKFGQIYRQASLEEVLDATGKASGELSVYVHSPFCATICKFCHYKGIEFQMERDEGLYSRFYGEYLPRVVKPFIPIIERMGVRSYFFGGGTPSLMSARTMREVFSLFPGLKATRSKVFEIHPAIWTDEQLDVLAEFGFNCAIIGIQSFDERVLERQNRLHAPVEQVRRLANGLKRRGIFAATDLIYRMDPEDADGIFARDLASLLSIDFDMVSLQHNYDDITNETNLNRFNQLIEASGILQHYRWELADKRGNKRRALPPNRWKMGKKCLRLVHRRVDLKEFRDQVFPFVLTINEVSKMNGSVAGKLDRSVLGFGSYKNPRKNTFSYIAQKDKVTEFIEVNDGWTPKYFVVYEESAPDRLDQLTALHEALAQLGHRPKEIAVSTVRDREVSRDSFIYRQVQPFTGLILRWKREDPAIIDFLSKARARFRCRDLPEQALLVQLPSRSEV